MKVVNTFEQMLPFGCLSLSLGLELKSTKYIAGIKSTRSLPVNTTWVLGCGGWHRLKESQYRRLMDRLLFFFFLDIVIFAATQIAVKYTWKWCISNTGQACRTRGRKQRKVLLKKTKKKQIEKVKYTQVALACDRGLWLKSVHRAHTIRPHAVYRPEQLMFQLQPLRRQGRQWLSQHRVGI